MGYPGFISAKAQYANLSRPIVAWASEKHALCPAIRARLRGSNAQPRLPDVVTGRWTPATLFLESRRVIFIRKIAKALNEPTGGDLSLE